MGSPTSGGSSSRSVESPDTADGDDEAEGSFLEILTDCWDDYWWVLAIAGGTIIIAVILYCMCKRSSSVPNAADPYGDLGDIELGAVHGEHAQDGVAVVGDWDAGNEPNIEISVNKNDNSISGSGRSKSYIEKLKSRSRSSRSRGSRSKRRH